MTESLNTPNVRVAIYARTASEHSNPGHLERQEIRCREAIAEQFPGCVVTEVFRDSGSYGRTGSRPGLESLLRRAAESPRPFSHVIVESSDRIGRSLALAFPILHLLHCHGVEVHFVDAPVYLRYETFCNFVISTFDEASRGLRAASC